MKIQEKNEKKRIVYFDYLRVVSTMAVVVLHVSAQNWLAFEGRSFEWQVFNFYDCIVRWGVPVFVMISGSLFLPRKIEIKTLFSKYILRMMTAFFAWSLLYAVYGEFLNLSVNEHYVITFESLQFRLFDGFYHMWFIPMIVGIYVCLPIIKQITKSEEAMKYFLCLGFVFVFVIPWIVQILNDFVGGPVMILVKSVNHFVSKLSIHLVVGEVFYFILGYYIANIDLNKKQRWFIYSLGVVGFVSTILLNGILAWKTNEPCQTYYRHFNLNVLLEAVGIFTWFKYCRYENENVNKYVSKLSKYSFGTYLVHALVLGELNRAGFNSVTFNPLVSVVVVTVVVTIISYVISWGLNKIPKLNKWIV